jgi:hypothetical protein
MKENIAYICGLILKYPGMIYPMLKFVKTPTDILRLTVSFSDGDVSLAKNTKFRKFKRPERKFLLGLLEKCNTNLSEEMVKYRGNFIRLGEILHPGEFKVKFPRSFKAFTDLREEKRIETFNTRVEESIINRDIAKSIKLLSTRPGDFARRLDHLFRINDNKPAVRNRISKEFFKVADKVSIPVMLQIYQHFKNRITENRIIFPKGQLAKVRVLENNLSKLTGNFSESFSHDIRNIIVSKLSSLEPLGKVFIDEKLSNYIIPFNQRSAQKAMKTIVRGSKIDLDGDYETIRFFIWWKNQESEKSTQKIGLYGSYGRPGRVDIDLSCQILDENFLRTSDIAYYDLRGDAGHHSGDITDAPNGASEFIDINLRKVLESGSRYVVMSVNSFTQQLFKDVPECFAGWMGRSRPNSGEIYEPKTVKNKFDLTAETTICLPLIIDALERKVIWMDLGLKQAPVWNNVFRNKNNISLTCKAMVNINRATLYDLFTMHRDARGKICDNKEKADIIFSETEGITPTDIDLIVSEYL